MSESLSLSIYIIDVMILLISYHFYVAGSTLIVYLLQDIISEIQSLSYISHCIIVLNINVK